MSHQRKCERCGGLFDWVVDKRLIAKGLEFTCAKCRNVASVIPIVKASVDRPVPRSVKSIGQPARRHRCEMCLKVFDCHLCEIDCDHDLHTPHRAWIEESVFVCESCIQEHQLVVAIAWMDGHYTIKFYDHLTGEVIGTGVKARSEWKPITFEGVTLTVPQWARRMGLTDQAMYGRMHAWGPEKALSVPRLKGKPLIR